MNYCHVEFTPHDADSLRRAQEIFALIRTMKAGDTPRDESRITELLTARERKYFWNPTSEELSEWNAHWAATPVAVRTSASMVCPQWDLESMYDAIWNGEYELVDIFKEGEKYFLAFNPEAYPYGGVSCFIAFLECFGHKVLGYDDGTGYVEHRPRELWHPRSRGTEA